MLDGNNAGFILWQYQWSAGILDPNIAIVNVFVKFVFYRHPFSLTSDKTQVGDWHALCT